MITPDDVRRLADLGLPLVYLHGKKPFAREWQKAPYTPADTMLTTFAEGLNIGIRTGPVSGAPCQVAVVDTDDADQEVWVAAHLPPTPWMTATRQGWHRLYRYPEGHRIVSSPRFLEGKKVCDVKGVGGQVVAPGSVHQSGHVYTPTRPWLPGDVAALPVYPLGLVPGDEGVAYQPAPTEDFPTAISLFNLRGGHALAERWLRRIVDPYYVDRRKYVSQAGRDSEGALYRVALTVRRGHPLCTPQRYHAAIAAGATLDDMILFDAQDADDAAVALLEKIYNPHAIDRVGRRYPWSRREIEHKVRDAGRSPTVPICTPYNRYFTQWEEACRRGDRGIAMLRTGARMDEIRRLPLDPI